MELLSHAMCAARDVRGTRWCDFEPIEEGTDD